MTVETKPATKPADHPNDPRTALVRREDIPAELQLQRSSLLPQLGEPDVPMPIDPARIQQFIKAVDDAYNALLDPQTDWETINGKKHLKLQAAQRLGACFFITEGEPVERPLEYRPIPQSDLPKWPAGMTEYPVATVFVTLATKNGRVCVRGGKFGANERPRKADGKFYAEDFTDHKLYAMAYSRAYKAALKQILGGVRFVDPRDRKGEDEEEETPATALPAPPQDAPGLVGYGLTETPPKPAPPAPSPPAARAPPANSPQRGSYDRRRF